MAPPSVVSFTACQSAPSLRSHAALVGVLANAVAEVAVVDVEDDSDEAAKEAAGEEAEVRVEAGRQ